MLQNDRRVEKPSDIVLLLVRKKIFVLQKTAYY